MVSKSKKKIHKTWGPPISGALLETETKLKYSTEVGRQVRGMARTRVAAVAANHFNEARRRGEWLNWVLSNCRSFRAV